ncbi:MAG: hypothetical protein JSW27_24695 [Phycisphaerales bacterium]|nr:MAG: hypothetical protein JSW27_24695 [Phycisphaerales bacterium]
MKTARQDGFVLTLVIVALGLMGVVMAVLAGAGNTMLFHADRAQVEAVERNLTASGLAWARHQALQPGATVTAQPVELDVRAFGIRQARLAVSFAQTDAGSVDVRIEASCSKGRQTARTQRQYAIVLAP